MLTAWHGASCRVRASSRAVWLGLSLSSRRKAGYSSSVDLAAGLIEVVARAASRHVIGMGAVARPTWINCLRSRLVRRVQ